MAKTRTLGTRRVPPGFLPGGKIPIKDILRAVLRVKRDRLAAEIAALDEQRTGSASGAPKPTPAQRRKLTIRRNALVQDLEATEAELTGGFVP